ncbi:MAG: phosphoglucomutase/phosphomannomutase family protein [Candidatus Omnitrophica bacterium]|nr:phosphoglucomutase/phosphomannomutase family protein [Candidatus Omnitrophota bacterium]
MAIRFGTEGWRAIMAEEFTVENVRRVTQAIAEHVRRPRPASRGGRARVTVAVGHDTRFLSDRFAQAVCEVLAGNGIRALLTDRAVPTCAVSRYVVANRLPAGVVVTASHNPGIYNGLKIKEAFGGSATTETVASVERRISRAKPVSLPMEEALARGLIQRVAMLPTFLQGIRRFVDVAAIRRSPFRVVVDSMHGTGARLIEGLLRGGRCRVSTLHADPDPLFGGHAPEPIHANLKELSLAVKRSRAHVGIANDGDADRIGLVGPGGAWVNPGQVMCVVLWHLVRTRKVLGAVVKTVSNTMMIDRMAQALDLRLVEVPVGFKHVAKLMLKGDVLIGGEESGGIGVKGYLPERDGILNGLLVLEAMAMRGQPLGAILAELEREFGRWAYARRDLHLDTPRVERLFRRLAGAAPDRMAGQPVARVNRLDGVKLIARDESWLLFRRSGTEPIVRIYAESPRARRVGRLLDFGVQLARDGRGA